MWRERGGDAQDDGVLSRQIGEGGGGCEALPKRFLDLFCINAQDVGAACREITDLPFIDVEARDLEAGTREQQG